MQARSDAQLLREYADHADDAAFHEIVLRHADLVYSAALRQVDSPDFARDVAQNVFTDLARKARSVAGNLSENSTLAGWLYRGTRFEALNLRRQEFRRQSRERQAMEQLIPTSEPPPDWDRLRPLLDEAMADLNDPDRDALLLRFFKNQGLREVGIALGVSDDTAQKRVSRALEKLRESLSRRGVTTAAGSLGFVIAANAVQSAPAGLAMAISAAAVLVETAVPTSTVIAATKTVAMTTLQKTFIGATLVIAVSTGIYEARQATDLRNQIQTLRQERRPLAKEIEQWQRERKEMAGQLAALKEENERLKRDTAELLKFRGEVARLRNDSRELAQVKAKDASDPTALAAQAWVERVKLLRQHFQQWPKKTPELQLLDEQDWLNEVVNFELENDEACRKAMSAVRFAAKHKFATAVNEALEQFVKANNDQLPSNPSQLMPYLKPPLNSFLDAYEIARPGWVQVPQPNSPNAERAATWALVAKGSFTSNGIAIRDGNILADPDYDMYMVIYRGGSYGYGK
jgi:RNA polymerase sigma factor (sigma-70 family)